MKILYLLFALFFLVVQSSAQDSDRSLIGTVVCVLRGGRCYMLKCPRGTRYIGRCSPWSPCCKRRVLVKLMTSKIVKAGSLGNW
ncbi:beta-defensin 3-like [Pelodiscus sinensis]|uniref:beta-defensin 3-like n=1 Tax=Pelodiscus sinensis TaxID=13735 RepID=UPI003F6CFAD3